MVSTAARSRTGGDARGRGATAGVRTSLLRSAGVRVLVLPLSAVLGIVNTRLIIENFGQAAYAQYGLLVGIGSLLPFADLGVSAAVMNAIAASDDPHRDPHVRKVLTTAIRVLLGSASVLLLISLTFLVTGLWPALLGEGLLPGSGPLVATLCGVMIAIAMPVGVGQRVMTGLGKNHITIALAGLQTPMVLLTLVLLVGTGIGGGAFVAVIPFVATWILAATATGLAAREISPALRIAALDAPHVRTVNGGGVFNTAWPNLIQMIALPIAMQTDRILLSHVSDLKNLAEYNLASQMFTPIWQVTSAAGVALWPIFARARAGKRERVSPIPIAFAFGGIAAAVALLISLVSPWLAARASGGQIHLGVPLLIAFSIFMVFQATKYPLGMFMTDPRGLRYQAFMIVLLLPVNLGLSWYLAARYGAVGPVVGSAVGVFCCQVLANWVYVRRTLRTPEATARVLPKRHRPSDPDAIPVAQLLMSIRADLDVTMPMSAILDDAPMPEEFAPRRPSSHRPSSHRADVRRSRGTR